MKVDRFEHDQVYSIPTYQHEKDQYNKTYTDFEYFKKISRAFSRDAKRDEELGEQFQTWMGQISDIEVRGTSKFEKELEYAWKVPEKNRKFVTNFNKISDDGSLVYFDEEEDEMLETQFDKDYNLP